MASQSLSPLYRFSDPFRKWGSAVAAFAVICWFSLACGPLFGQVNTGRILGTVTDQTGGAIAGAMVTVTNSQTGVARNLTTDQAGEYVAPNLNPGTYAVRATFMGFQTFERQNITVGLGQDSRVDAQLTPGQVTQTLEVTAAAPMLDATSAVVSGTLNTQTIVDLPLNGRNYENLLVIRPGVVAQPGGGTLTTAVNGLAPSDNNSFIEGLDSNEPFTGQAITNTTLPFGDAATILPIDAIQELNVETNAPAEFGRRPGAVINIGIKSGTNTIHGSAYAFGRDGAWDATDFVSPPITAQPLQLQQWGGTIGGPIVKNKLFYFGGFERQSYSVGNAFATNTPTYSAASGDPSQSIPVAEAALAAAGVSLSPLSLKLLPLYGINNNPTSALTRGFPDIFGINNAVGKVDYHPNDHHTITGSYFFGNGNANGEDGAYTEQIFDTIGTMRAEFLTSSWTWTPNSTWVNDLRFGWNHYHRATNVGDYQTPVTSYGLNTGVTDPLLQGLPAINVGAFASIGGDFHSPRNFGPASDYDLVDHISWLHGKHAFKFGAEILYFNAFFDQITNGRGSFNFDGGSSLVNSPIPNMTALEAFLAGLPNTLGGASLLEGSPARTYTQKDISGFFEDSWRATSKLTVNMGLRYEYYTPLSEINNEIGNWSPTVGFEQVGVNINSAYNPDSKDISPRLGIAWDVSGNGTTVIRAGAGLYYTNQIALQFVGLQGGLPAHQVGIAAIPTAFTLVMPNGSTVAPLKANGGMGTSSVSLTAADLNWSLAGPVFPASSTGGLVCGNGLAPVNPVPGAPATNPAPCSIFATDPNLPSPRITSWNLGIQHALTPTLAVEVDYIGNHGSNLPGVTDLNQINPNSPSEIACGYCDQVTDLPYYSQYPYLQYIDYMSNTEYSNYNALQATLTARSFHNLSFIAGYTYSHALTEEPGTGYGIATAQNPSAPQLDYGATNFDIRHHFSFTPTYILPGKKSPLQLLEGWSVQSAVLIETGMPWSPVDSQNVSGTGEQQDRWDFFGNPSDFNVGPNPIPFYGDAGSMPAMCLQEAAAIGTTATSLPAYGCYAAGHSVMIAPPPGQFGTMPRNFFYGPGFADWDFSIFKNWKFKERLTAQFRAEFFNILNHPIYASPGLVGNTDPSTTTTFGCACETPDQASTNPVLGTGGARAIQLGLKLLF